MDINHTPVADIAAQINAQLKGDDKQLVTGINEIHKVRTGDLTFVDHPKYYNKALESAATIIIIDQDVDVPEGKTILVHDRPFEAYNSLTKHYRPYKPIEHPISPESDIHESATIMPGCVIGDFVTIGKNTIIYPNVTIYSHSQIGDNCIIHSGTVIGADAFYYKKEKEYIKWHSVGRVLIKNNVEIGANCCIDKGVSGDTIIGAGSKLDNMCHIAHGVVIGERVLMAACCAIGGKTRIENDVIMWGQVGVSKDVTIGEGAILSAQAGVSKSLEGGKHYFGSPAIEARQKYKEMAILRRLAKEK